MTKRKALPLLAPEYVIGDYRRMLALFRTNVDPPYTIEEIEAIKYGWFLMFRFAQANGLTTRTLVDKPDDLEMLVVRVGDYTADGFRIFRLGEERYLNALDRGTAPEKAIKILERDLKKLREGKWGEWEAMRTGSANSDRSIGGVSA